jgi:hypothetical protein
MTAYHCHSDCACVPSNNSSAAYLDVLHAADLPACLLCTFLQTYCTVIQALLRLRNPRGPDTSKVSAATTARPSGKLADSNKVQWYLLAGGMMSAQY